MSRFDFIFLNGPFDKDSMIKRHRDIYADMGVSTVCASGHFSFSDL